MADWIDEYFEWFEVEVNRSMGARATFPALRKTDNDVLQIRYCMHVDHPGRTRLRIKPSKKHDG